MDKEKLQSLKMASVGHWRINDKAAERGCPEDMDLAEEYCPFCREFKEPADDGEDCDGCPVKEATGEPGCRNTPYGGAWAAWLTAKRAIFVAETLTGKPLPDKERQFICVALRMKTTRMLRLLEKIAGLDGEES